MNEKDQNLGLYDKAIGFLKRPFFHSLANILSHGGIHFLFSIIIFGAIFYYLFYFNSQDIITPHNIGLDLGYPSYKQGTSVSTADSINGDVNIKIKLNSDSIARITNKKYHNGVITEFYRENNIYEHTIITNGKQEKAIDSFLIVSIYTEPRIKGCMTKVNSIYMKTNTVEIAPILARTETISDCISVYVPPIGSKCNVSFFSDSIGVDAHNPYYYYYIFIPTQKFVDNLTIEFSTTDEKRNGYSGLISNNGKNLQYSYVFPEPDIISNGKICYYSKEKKEAIGKNKGIILQAVDVNELNRQNRNAFLYSVLVGTALAFLLDIIIQLIRELKRLQRRKE